MIPRIFLGARDPLVDEPFGLKVKGVSPGRRLRLRASCVDAHGVTYESWAEFAARADTCVDAAKQRPLDGTYRGVDPYGLWWSMASVPERSFPRDLLPIPTIVSVEVGGEHIAQVELMRLRMGRSVRILTIRSGGLVATFFLPDVAAPSPGLMVLGGSEGGLPLAEEFAALLASHGFATLAVAYFAVAGLPERLVRIPLEYLEQAARWMLRRPEVLGPGIGVVGISRGGELALLLASICPCVRAVVGIAASSVLWPGFTTGIDYCAAWVRRGKDLPFALPQPQAPSPDSCGPLECKKWFLRALRRRRQKALSMIPVERIHGAMLLVSGGDDKLWPSRLLAEYAIRRLADVGGDGIHLTYSRAGHGVGRLPGLPAAPTVFVSQDGIRHALGGSKAANARSAQRAWPKVLSFLSEHLRASASAHARRTRSA